MVYYAAQMEGQHVSLSALDRRCADLFFYWVRLVGGQGDVQLQHACILLAQSPLQLPVLAARCVPGTAC